MNNNSQAQNKIFIKSPSSKPKHIRDDSSIDKNQKLKTVQSCRRFTTQQYDKINMRSNQINIRKINDSRSVKNNIRIDPFNQIPTSKPNKTSKSLKNIKNLKISTNQNKRIQNYIHFFSPKHKNITNPYGFKQISNKNSSINLLSKSGLKKYSMIKGSTNNKVNKTHQEEKITPFNAYPVDKQHKFAINNLKITKKNNLNLNKVQKHYQKVQKQKILKTSQNQQFSIIKHRNSNKEQSQITKKNVERSKMYHNVKMKTEQSMMSCESTPSQLFTHDIQLLELIGEGTFGKVYKGLVKKTSQIVAVKKVLQDKKYKNRQVQIISLLNHSTFIMKVYGTYMSYQGTNSQNPRQYLNIVMKYYQTDLFKQIQVKNTLKNIQIKLYAYQIFRGLLYLHSKDICHRDIKPHNILINKMSVAICDFGSAKVLNPAEKNLPYICSRCYRAPQLIFGSTQYTTMIDIWSVGCVLLQMIYSAPFFIGNSSIDHLIEVIKILGTPTKTQVKQMNPQYDLKDYKFPNIKSKSLKKLFPQTDPLLINLLEQIMIYAPKERLNAAEALVHEYFDQLRKQQIYQELKAQYWLPDFFDFTPEQMKDNQHLYGQLVPDWYSKTHETYFQDQDIQKNNMLKFYYD